MDSMFEILLGLPLLKGVTHERIAEIAGKAKFHFLKYLPGETIINPGDKCTHLKFIISGSVRMSVANMDQRFTVSQILQACDVIAPEYLFGRSTQYPCKVDAVEATGILQIDKADYIKILNSDTVFMFNYLNALSSRAQKGIEGILSVATGNLEQRLAFWIISLTQPGGRDITMTCRQRDLYTIFGVQRSTFIATLDAMRDQGLIEYNSSEIKVHDRRELLAILDSHSAF